MPMVPKTHSPEIPGPLNINANGVLDVWCLFYVGIRRAPMPEKLGEDFGGGMKRLAR